MTQSNLPNVVETKNMLNEYFTHDLDTWPEGLANIYETYKIKDVAIQSLGLSIKYLKNLMLDSQILPFATFYHYKGTAQGAYLNSRDYMTLNGNALENLEIFLTTSSGQTTFDATTNFH